MKKKILILLLLSLAGASQAQQILACQFTDSNGFNWESGRWVRSAFKNSKPFFVRLDNTQNIDPKSLETDVLFFYAGDTVCKKFMSPKSGLRVGCSEPDSGNSIVINLETLAGAHSLISGAASKSLTKDSVAVKLFECQKM
jgi:hypothetical protein